MYDYPQLKKDIDNTGVGILELSNTAQEYIKELNKISIKNHITRSGTLFLNTTIGMTTDKDVPITYEYDTTLITKLKEKIIDINKTMDSVWENYKYKDITYTENSHNPTDTDITMWYFSGSYEKLTILRKWLVDNYKTSIFQMWYEVSLQNIQSPTGIDAVKIHEELTKIYLELYGDLEEVQNFGRKYNPKVNLANQTFRLQVYEEGCFISPHRDGGGGHCSMLLYTNENYVEGMGGELVCIDSKSGRKKEITVPPTIGTLVIVDFKSNPSHAINVIKEKDWMRTTIGAWWPAGTGY